MAKVAVIIKKDKLPRCSASCRTFVTADPAHVHRVLLYSIKKDQDVSRSWKKKVTFEYPKLRASKIYNRLPFLDAKSLLKSSFLPIMKLRLTGPYQFDSFSLQLIEIHVQASSAPLYQDIRTTTD